MAFSGWPPQAIDFFDGLEEDNSKEYWQAQKEVYERSVRDPMLALLAELEPEFGPGKLFRPYRDTRFSKDKSPYKTQIAAMVGEGGYVMLSAAGLGTGSGMYHMASDQLERFRAAVVDDRRGRELDGLVETVRKKGHDVVAHEVLKTAPRGIAKDHPRIEILRMKGLAAFHLWEPQPWLSTKKAKDHVAGVLRDARPLEQWLEAHVGPTELVYERR